jgi:hypothetical protein
MGRQLQAARVGVLCGALALAVLLSAGGGRALAGEVGCGATITADTRLSHDLRGCPNVGLVIGADDITLDLDGHTASGDGQLVASCPEGATCDVGIDNTAGHDNVTIKGGSVRAFDVGVFTLGQARTASTGCRPLTTRPSA